MRLGHCLLVLGLLLGSAAVAATPEAREPQAETERAERAERSDGAEILDHGRFKQLRLYRPAKPATSFVLLLSGDQGMDADMRELAQMLAASGALVAGISTDSLLDNLEKDGGKCVFTDGDMDNLSRYLQAYARLSTYFPPIMVGYDSGATLTYALMAQAKPTAFGGALLMGFSPRLALNKPLCKGEGVDSEPLPKNQGTLFLPVNHIKRPIVALSGEADKQAPIVTAQAFMGLLPGASFVRLHKVTHAFSRAEDWMPQFKTAFAGIAAQAQSELPSVPKSIADLPVIELPVQDKSDTFAILLSGDGGWASIDKDIGGALVDSGMPVVGFDSLRYFWEERAAEHAAADIDRLIRFYSAQWHAKKVLLIGYSQGADVLPFIYNRLPRSSRLQVALLVPIALGPRAAFEFHLGNWVGGSGDVPTMPEVQKLADSKTFFCIYGEAQKSEESLCNDLDPKHYRTGGLPGGHHFNGAYKDVAALILQQAAARK